MMKFCLSLLILFLSCGCASLLPDNGTSAAIILSADRYTFDSDKVPISLFVTFTNKCGPAFVVSPESVDSQYDLKYAVRKKEAGAPAVACNWDDINAYCLNSMFTSETIRYLTLRSGETAVFEEEFFKLVLESSDGARSTNNVGDLLSLSEERGPHIGSYLVRAYYKGGLGLAYSQCPWWKKPWLLRKTLASNIIEINISGGVNDNAFQQRNAPLPHAPQSGHSEGGR